MCWCRRRCCRRFRWAVWATDKAQDLRDRMTKNCWSCSNSMVDCCSKMNCWNWTAGCYLKRSYLSYSKPTVDCCLKTNCWSYWPTYLPRFCRCPEDARIKSFQATLWCQGSGCGRGVNTYRPHFAERTLTVCGYSGDKRLQSLKEISPLHKGRIHRPVLFQPVACRTSHLVSLVGFVGCSGRVVNEVTLIATQIARFAMLNQFTPTAPIVHNQQATAC